LCSFVTTRAFLEAGSAFVFRQGKHHCLKIEAEPASGTLCFITKIKDGRNTKKGNCVSESYTNLKG
jgi:hypothetical protein